jgi:hypothetical protein
LEGKLRYTLKDNEDLTPETAMRSGERGSRQGWKKRAPFSLNGIPSTILPRIENR